MTAKRGEVSESNPSFSETFPNVHYTNRGDSYLQTETIKKANNKRRSYQETNNTSLLKEVFFLINNRTENLVQSPEFEPEYPVWEHNVQFE